METLQQTTTERQNPLLTHSRPKLAMPVLAAWVGFQPRLLLLPHAATVTYQKHI